MAAVNRTGFEGTRGSGFGVLGQFVHVADPFGRVIQQATATEETVLIAECDPKKMDEVTTQLAILCATGALMPTAPITQRWLA